jgi:tetratricopeptide (TPR) repeat protein
MFMEEHRWTESEQHLQQALKQDPDNALAHYWYSYLLSIFGDYQQALVEMQRAAALDPWSAVVNDRLALAYLWVGDLAGATRQYQIATDLGYLESNQVSPAVLYAVRRQDWEAIRTLLLRLGNDPGWVEAFVTGLADPALRPASAGIIDQAMAEGQIDRRFWFGIWVLLKDSDRAFRDFNAQPKSQDIELLWARDSAFLRQDPRFEDLVHSVGLADRARATFPD